jgi:sugar lactone lactonase YvrE
MSHHRAVIAGSLIVVAVACGRGEQGGTDSADSAAARRDTATLVKSIDGFRTPESVKWDADAGVWYVANIDGQPTGKDNNGFISRLDRDGNIDSLEFIRGGRGGVTLNAPKGMAISGDTLFVADIDALRAFNRRTGAPIRSWELGRQATFLNDVAIGADGRVFVTDTRVTFTADGISHTDADRIFVLDGRRQRLTSAIQSDSLGRPNGIVWDDRGKRFIIVPFGANTIRAWTGSGNALTAVATGAGQYDGIEMLPDGRMIVSSWADSSLSLIDGDSIRKLVGGLAAPADIGLDPARSIVAVPRFNDGRVDLYRIGR